MAKYKVSGLFTTVTDISFAIFLTFSDVKFLKDTMNLLSHIKKKVSCPQNAVKSQSTFLTLPSVKISLIRIIYFKSIYS